MNVNGSKGERKMKNYRTRALSRRVRYALLAGMAGAFLIPQTVSAGPTGEHDYTAGVAVSRAGSTTNIGASAANNVIKWQDYSVQTGETVAYDTKNYLNLVTGGGSSAINGSITGGGDIYLVNPNGVIFGKTASVNVGNLHVSTQDLSAINATAFLGGSSPINTAVAGKTDVVNMGTLSATNVEVVGKSIRFLNAADVTGSVVMHTDTANDGTAHIGYRGSVPTGGYTVNGAAATAADNYYQLVGTTAEFQNINNDLTQNYMLENDIDFAGNPMTPIGGNSKPAFTGKFDGNFFAVKNFTVTGLSRTGLFGDVSGSRIENFGVTGATLTTAPSSFDYVGAIAGSSTGGAVFKNVYAKDTLTKGRPFYTGGLIGVSDHTTISSSYSKVTTNGGGFIGRAQGTGTVLNDIYSDINIITGTPGTYVVYSIDNPTSGGLTINNAYAAGEISNTGTTAPPINNTYLVDKAAGTAKLVGISSPAKDATALSTYAAWGNTINNDGAPGAKWRIYEGRTTPMLTAFMNGAATANYNYRYFNTDKSVSDTSAGAVKSNGGKDVTGLTYNSKYVKIVGTPDTTVGGKSNVVYEGGTVDLTKVHDYVNSSTQDFDKTNGVRNVGTKAMLWSDQDGPNLRGVNVTIDPREVKLTGGNLDVTRMYNGKKSVKDAFVYALTHGGVSYDGFTQDDINDNSVALDTTNFTADMADKNVVRNTDGTYGQKPVTFGGTIDFSGEDKKNYKFDNSSISTLTGKVRITPAPLYLTITKKKADDKIYDGTDIVVDNAMKQTVTPPNIKLNDTITDGTSDGTRMIDDGGTVDTVSIKPIADPTYTNSAGVAQIHAGSHKLQYTNAELDTVAHPDGKNYDLYYQPLGGTKTKVTDGKLYLDGDIVRRKIDRDSFTVYKSSDNSEASVSKVYDRTDTYTPEAGLYLSSNDGASTDPDAGIVARDKGHITFQLAGNAYFTNNGGAHTKNVAEATKVAYTAKGQADTHTDQYGGHLLSDYYVLNADGVTKDPLDGIFTASGKGKITPKTLTPTVKNGNITKVYDALKAHTETGDSIISLAGIITGDVVSNDSTAEYATKNVVYSGGTPTTQNVTYTAKFSIANAAEAQNYTFDPQPATTPVTTTKTLNGLGTITPRPISLTFGSVTKVYDGTVTNTTKNVTAVDDGTGGVVLGRDGISPLGSLPPTLANNITSRYGNGSTEGTFQEDRNAGSRSVEYANIKTAFNNAFGNNYTIADKQYGTGTITRRRIDPSGFKVRKADGTLADATKVYDGTDTYTLAPGAYLTGAAASGNTGIVTHDFGKVVFELKSGSPGHFAKDAAGANRTSHVSEAQYIAYDVTAKTLDPTNNPLTNYEFGTVLSKRGLETVTDASPAQVTAGGTITPASLHAVPQEITKVYDGLADHTDGNRQVVKGDSVISFTGWATGQTRTNNSSATYADKNVARDGSGNVIKKTVTYRGQLTGQYADDYQIVDAGNNVISTKTGSGASTAVTMNAPITLADMGTITPRKLNIKMGDVSKTYDGNATNTSSSVTQITDDPVSSVIGTILSGDSVTTGALQTAYSGMLTANTATSTYGRGTTTFTANPNASNGTPHDVQYTNMDTAFKNAFSGVAGNYTVDALVYGKGTINRRDISPNNFKVKDLMGNVVNATKVYDGSSAYTVPAGWQLVPGGGTGVVAGDNVNFRLAGSGAKFQNNANVETPNAFDATKVAYQVEAYGDAEKIKNYKLNGQNLESGTASVYGAGTITRRTLELSLVQSTGIDKEYDRQSTLTGGTKHWNALTKTDSAGNVQYATGSNELVNDGTSFSITSNYMNDAGTAPDKNVKRSGGAVVDKNIQYDITIAGGDARNYAFKQGGVTSNAEAGLKLAATGKITPKDLSGAFKKVTKVFDNTTSVPASQVGFVPGNVLAGDTVTLGAHTESFQSANVNGDGSTWTPMGGTAQKNWVNYSGLTLAGADAGNYTIDSTTRGLGEITPLSLNPSNITFNIAQATKTYDGTTAVKHSGSSALTDVKNYITSATTMVNSTPVDVLPDLSVTGAAYDTKNVTGGPQPRVTYTLKYTGASGNFTIGSGTFTKQANGIITKKDVTVTVKSPVSKVYDATTTLTGVAKNSFGATVTNANDLIQLTGLIGSDNATYTTTAVYDDKNAGSSKQVNYTLSLDAANAGNYSLKYGGGNGSAFSTNDNTITKRKVDVTFAPVTKTYDTTATNTSITGTVSAADEAVLNTDSAGLVNGAHALTNLSGLNSEYGAGTGSSFTANPNAGTNKDVRYQGLGAQMGTTLGANAANYEFAADGFGKGTITKANINPGDVIFGTSQATKIYDGTKAVKYGENAAPGAVKNYFTNAMWNGHNVLNAFDVDTAEYDNKDVNGGAVHNITYKLKLNGANSNFQMAAPNLTANGTGVITKKDVTATVKSPVSKVYDATTTVVGVAKNAANAVVANANDLIGMTGFTGNDGASYTATAVYADKNAGTGNKTVNYTLAIDGANAGNYNLKYGGVDNAGAFSTNDNTITKRTVDVSFAHVTKTYDGTPTNTSITPSVSAADATVLAADNAARVSGTTITGLTGITSQYGSGTTDGTFAADPNAGANKSVQYAGLGTAMGTAFGANNYEFATNGYGTGTINKANINASDVTFAASNAAKVYDGTRTVKYGGSSASSDVKNYITTATVTLNGNTIDLRNDLVMDMAGTQYSSPNATNGTPDTVTYKFYLNNSNINIAGDNNFIKTAQGTIDRRVLKLDLRKKSGIDKIYDANANLVDTNTYKYGMFTDDDANGNVTYAAGTTNDNKLVRTANGGAVDDGAVMTVQANYVDNLISRTPDKNVARDGGGNVTTKDIGYHVSIDGAAGSNYQLSDGVTTVNAETGLDTLSAQGTITPRKLALGFGDARKAYDTLTDNTLNKNVNAVTADDSDGRGAAAIAADGITNASFDMTNVVSHYGAGNTDATFQRDPNVVTDANDNVIERGKDVQYANLAGTLAGQPYGSNYEIADTAYGKGTIVRRRVHGSDFSFNVDPATKMYDGTDTVYYHEGGKSFSDMGHVKKYFQGSTLDLGGGQIVNINLDDIDLQSAKYNDVNASPSNSVDYGVRINTRNFVFDSDAERNHTFTHYGDVITKRNLATMLPQHLVKEYDGETTFTESNAAFADAMAKENLTPIVARDKGKISLSVVGTYSSKNASAETRAEAEARTPLEAQRTVDYTLTLSGDAAALQNYEIDGNPTSNTVTGRAADIYKKTLTARMDPIDKLYDGTRTVVRPDGTGIAPHPAADKLHLDGFVHGESFDFDQTAADKIDGLYSDPNVSRAPDGSIQDKNISYQGIQNAFADNATRDTTGQAQNYRIDRDTAEGKGKILPRPIHADDITRDMVFAPATKVYDGTKAVKYNGVSTPEALKNYLTHAAVTINGTQIDIKDDLAIKSDEADTHYDTPHVTGGAQPRVTYGLTYTGGNFDVIGDLTKQADGVITKRKVTAYAPGQLTKVYDGTNKVYDPLDDSVKTYYRGTRVTDGDSVVQMSQEDGDTGLLANDGVKNISTATYDNKNAGTGKTVTYDVAIDAAHAGDYEIVDVHGNAVSQLTTKNNEITKRRLDIGFDPVSKFYDASSTNTAVTAHVTDADARRTLRRDHAGFFGNRLIFEDAAGNALSTPSDYGYGTTDASFTPDANADTNKSVQYRGVGDALRTMLGNDAGNYDFDETGYGTGTIKKAIVNQNDFRLKFNDAVKEYDGDAKVLEPLSHLNKTDSRIQREGAWRNYNLPDTDIASITGTYLGTDGRTPDKNAGDHKIVDYTVKLSDRNFDFGTWDGVIKGEGGGAITKRRLIADTPRYLTKEYDGTREIVNRARDMDGNLITGSGDALLRFRHASDPTGSALIAGDDVRNETTASYAGANVAWKDGAWKNGYGTADDMDVNYDLAISGTDAANYEIVNADGKTVGKGRITPKDIVLKANPETRYINDGMPEGYTGTPSGKNYATGVHGEVLPGEIYYNSPNGRLRWGDYAINGYYRAADKAQYQRPDGSRYQLADGTPDGDSVSRNYRFVQDPANGKAFHMGPYIPEYEYYKTLAQLKMIPDEYAYENASLDRRNYYSRKPEAEVSHMPPAVNLMKDGTDIRKMGIRITDETVFTLMNEVFG